MKTKKRAFYGTCILTLIILSILFACKKDSSVSANSEVSDPRDQPNILARGTGTETVYSVDTNGVHYKMILVWNTSTGAVTIDRSIVTSGYPVDVEQICAVDPEIDVTQIDNDSDPSSFDTLIINCNNTELDYYAIKFNTNLSDPVMSIEPHGYPLSCECKGNGNSCSVRSNGPDKYYCSGCSKCLIYIGKISDSEGAEYIPTGGLYFLEATSVTLIH